MTHDCAVVGTRGDDSRERDNFSGADKTMNFGTDETKERAGNEKSRDAVQKIGASIPTTRATTSGS